MDTLRQVIELNFDFINPYVLAPLVYLICVGAINLLYKDSPKDEEKNK